MRAEPTAKQLFTLRHETPLSVLATEPGTGDGTIDQPVPFQRSINARVGPFAEVPTAMQKEAVTHDTCCS